LPRRVIQTTEVIIWGTEPIYSSATRTPLFAKSSVCISVWVGAQAMGQTPKRRRPEADLATALLCGQHRLSRRQLSGTAAAPSPRPSTRPRYSRRCRLGRGLGAMMTGVKAVAPRAVAHSAATRYSRRSGTPPPPISGVEGPFTFPRFFVGISRQISLTSPRRLLDFRYTVPINLFCTSPAARRSARPVCESRSGFFISPDPKAPASPTPPPCHLPVVEGGMRGRVFRVANFSQIFHWSSGIASISSYPTLSARTDFCEFLK